VHAPRQGIHMSIYYCSDRMMCMLPVFIHPYVIILECISLDVFIFLCAQCV
jgi:hypothetical protein